MNRTNSNTGHPVKLLVAVAVSLVLAACASAPVKSTGAADARAKLTVLQSDPNLASRAPVQMSEAVAAVTAAEVVSQDDQEQGAYLAYLADRKVDTARARAEVSLAEDQRAKLAQQRDSARLDARTREADTAKNQVATARAETDTAKDQAATARAEQDSARIAAAQQTEELQRQIDELQAKPTDRGLVLTLGDVLFTTGMADLNAGAASSLDKTGRVLSITIRKEMQSSRAIRTAWGIVDDDVEFVAFNRGCCRSQAMTRRVWRAPLSPRCGPRSNSARASFSWTSSCRNASGYDVALFLHQHPRAADAN